MSDRLNHIGDTLSSQEFTNNIRLATINLAQHRTPSPIHQAICTFDISKRDGSTTTIGLHRLKEPSDLIAKLPGIKGGRMAALALQVYYGVLGPEVYNSGRLNTDPIMTKTEDQRKKFPNAMCSAQSSLADLAKRFLGNGGFIDLLIDNETMRPIAIASAGPISNEYSRQMFTDEPSQRYMLEGLDRGQAKWLIYFCGLHESYRGAKITNLTGPNQENDHRQVNIPSNPVGSSLYTWMFRNRVDLAPEGSLIVMRTKAGAVHKTASQLGLESRGEFSYSKPVARTGITCYSKQK